MKTLLCTVSNAISFGCAVEFGKLLRAKNVTRLEATLALLSTRERLPPAPPVFVVQTCKSGALRNGPLWAKTGEVPALLSLPTHSFDVLILVRRLADES